MPDLLISLQFEADSTSNETADEILRSFTKCGGSLSPEFLSIWEGEKEKYISQDQWRLMWARTAEMTYDDVSHQFHTGLRWFRNRKPKYSSEVTHSERKMGRVTPGHLLFNAKYDPSIDWVELLAELVLVLKPFAGMMHIFPENDSSPYSFNDPKSAFWNGVLYSERTNKLTGVAHFMVISEFVLNSEKIRQLEGSFCKVEEVYEGCWLLMPAQVSKGQVSGFSQFAQKFTEIAGDRLA